jgi:small-conductance mechanosensitive channel
MVFRVLGGVIGLFAAAIAMVGPLLFISNELQEADSARQNGGHLSILGAVGSSLTVLVLAGFLAFIAFVLLRFSLRGSKPH